MADEDFKFIDNNEDQPPSYEDRAAMYRTNKSYSNQGSNQGPSLTRPDKPPSYEDRSSMSKIAERSFSRENRPVLYMSEKLPSDEERFTAMSRTAKSFINDDRSAINRSEKMETKEDHVVKTKADKVINEESEVMAKIVKSESFKKIFRNKQDFTSWDDVEGALKVLMTELNGNGPVSVQDADDTMMNNERDSNRSSNRVTSASSHNHVGSSPANDSNEVKRRRPVDDDGPTEKTVNNIDARTKGLSIEQIKDKVTSCVADLKSMEEYHHGDGMKCQKSIGDIYWDYTSDRQDIGDLLTEENYAEITIGMLKQMNSLGIFKNDDIWFPTYYTYMTLWNYSDASEKLARSLAEHGAVKLMTLNLGHKPYLDNMHSKNVYYVLKASLSILHNIARCTGVKHHFKDIKTAEVIMPLINSNDEFLKSIGMLTLAFIVEEDENAKLIDETGTIKSIVSWIHRAIENKQKRRFRGFTPTELTNGLGKLAVNDSNKSKIIDEGALGDFLSMLQHNDSREHASCAECIWILAFDKEVRQAMFEYPDLVPALESLQHSDNPVVQKNVLGALWLINGENNPAASALRPHNTNSPKNHIFISYSYNEKELVKKIYSSLSNEGYKLWVDWEQTGGSSLQSISEAIENSAVVLVCMSERYKQSPSCRTESDFTCQLKKDYIPLMMQKRYRPDGWLAAILGAKLHFDFSGKHPYEKPLTGLLKELRGRGKSGTLPSTGSVGKRSFFGKFRSLGRNSSNEIDASPDAMQQSVVSSASFSDASPPAHYVNVTPTAAVVAMSNEHVETWLVSKGLQRFSNAFSQIDGQLIWQLKRMRESAPEFYHHSLERQFGMTLIDILRFNAALDSLR